MAQLGRSAFDNKALATQGSANGTTTWHGSLIIENDLTVLGTETFTGDQAVDGNFAVSGTVTLSAAASRLIGGATSFSIRNAANSADNLLITNAGVVTARAGLVATTGGVTATAGNFVASALGAGLQVKRGVNAKGGTFTANEATPVPVANTSVTTESVIHVSIKTAAGTPGPVVSVVADPGVGFVFTGTALDTSVYNYSITELIP